jgi:hypothetical protein
MKDLVNAFISKRDRARLIPEVRNLLDKGVKEQRREQSISRVVMILAVLTTSC